MQKPVISSEDPSPVGPAEGPQSRDRVAAHFNRVQSRLTPLARGVFSIMRRNGSLTSLDAARSSLGVQSSGSVTRRLTELRDVGFDIHREYLTDDVTGRRYAKWSIAGVHGDKRPVR